LATVVDTGDEGKDVARPFFCRDIVRVQVSIAGDWQTRIRLRKQVGTVEGRFFLSLVAT
jgi:hypothetical protein